MQACPPCCHAQHWPSHASHQQVRATNSCPAHAHAARQGTHARMSMAPRGFGHHVGTMFHHQSTHGVKTNHFMHFATPKRTHAGMSTVDPATMRGERFHRSSSLITDGGLMAPPPTLRPQRRRSQGGVGEARPKACPKVEETSLPVPPSGDLGEMGSIKIQE